MNRLVLLLVSVVSLGAMAEYSVRWTWDVKPPSSISAGTTFTVKGHWDVTYSASPLVGGTASRRLPAIWEIASGSGEKQSASSFKAYTTLTLWGSATPPSSEVPSLCKYVTIRVDSSSGGGGSSGGGSTSSLDELYKDTTHYWGSKDYPQTDTVISTNAISTIPKSGINNKITSVRVGTRYPWSGMVDLTYSITGNVNAADAKVCITGVSSSGGLNVKTLEGDLSASAGEHKIVWDASKDMADKDVTNASLRVELVEDTSIKDCLANHPKYIAIDLSGGTNASHYAVEAISEVPVGGWTKEYKTNKLVLRRIEAGEFMMGCPTSEPARAPDDAECAEDLHKVVLTHPFYIGIFEITQRQWELVAGTRPSFFTNNQWYAELPVEALTYNVIRGSNQGRMWPQTAQVDTNSFLGVLRLKSGIQTVDIPTEAQWEYACRAGTSTAQYDGNNDGSGLPLLGHAAKNGNYWLSERNVVNPELASLPYKSAYIAFPGSTCPVGRYIPNAWGLYDMYGNAWEFVRDRVTKHLGFSCVTNPVGPASGDSRAAIVRGGGYNCSFPSSYVSNPGYGYNNSFGMCRSAARCKNLQYFFVNGYVYPVACGFRVVIEVED